MQYMLLVYWNEAARKGATKEKTAETFAAYMAYTEALKKAGAFVAGSGLQDSSTATVVRAPDGKRTVLNGPYIESKEQLGGYYLIDAADLMAPSPGRRVVPALSRTRWRFAHSWSIDPLPCREETTRLPSRLPRRLHAEATASWSPFSRRAHAMSPRLKTPCRRPLPLLWPIGPSTARR